MRDVIKRRDLDDLSLNEREIAELEDDELSAGEAGFLQGYEFDGSASVDYYDEDW